MLCTVTVHYGKPSSYDCSILDHLLTYSYDSLMSVHSTTHSKTCTHIFLNILSPEDQAMEYLTKLWSKTIFGQILF